MDREEEVMSTSMSEAQTAQASSQPQPQQQPRVAVNVAEEEEEDERVDLVFAARSLLSLLTPVSITMVLTALGIVWLPDESSSSAVGLDTYLAKDEQQSSSDGEKLGAAVLNAIIFVAAICGVTFVLVCLYYFRLMKVLVAWLILSVVALLGGTGAFVLFRILVRLDIPVDAISFYIFVWNFTIVGVLAIFWVAPERVKQGYLVCVSAIMAFILALLPEWTTWCFVIALSLYDLCAVLSPCGPLKWLIGLAQERQDPIPALLYEARPNEGANEVNRSPQPAEYAPMPVSSSSTPGVSPNPSPSPSKPAAAVNPTNIQLGAVSNGNSAADEDSDPDSQARMVVAASSPAARNVPEQRVNIVNDEDLDEERTIKLGLGDFVIYSLMVGRAATFGFATAVATFFAILNGLGATLLGLAILRKALPALPISVMFGVVFYFITRLLIVPYMVEYMPLPLFI